MFFIAGIAIAVFIECLLLGKKDKSFADKILSIWILYMTIHTSFFYMEYNEVIYQYPHLLGLEIPMPLLHGVFLYLYVAAHTNQLPKKRNALLLHFIPFLAILTYMISFYLRPVSEKIYVFQNEGLGYETFMMIHSVMTAISGILYIVWSSILLKQHRKNILNQFSDIEKIDLQWLQFLVWGLAFIWGVVLFTDGGYYIFSSVVVFIFFIGIFGVKQGRIFTIKPPSNHASTETNANALPETETPQENNGIKKEKYAKSGLKEADSKALYQQLIQLIQDESLYTKGELSIGELAEKLKSTPNHLSQIINENEGKNFYDFINSYRINDFKKRIALAENKKLTLLSIAFDCGFNSKSSFNRYFKKATGETPSQYFKKITEEGSQSA